MIDTQGRITYINRSAEILFGWNDAELLGKNIHEVTHYKRSDGTAFPATECPLLQVLKNGMPLREHEDTFIRKDGAMFPVVCSASPLNVEGALAGLVLGFRDNSKRRQTEGALKQSESEKRLHLQVETLESRILERTAALEAVTGKLRELTGALLQTQDEERRRIARELHDGIGQLVVAISMNLSKITGEKDKLSTEANLTLDQNIALIEQASREIRTMSHLLHPPLLDEVGLDSALRWYVEGFSERSKISVTLQLAPGFTEGLPRDLALCVFRLVQECLTNIHRHAESPNALVTIRRTADELILLVQDDGIGIPSEIQTKILSGQSPGVGLRGMRERIWQFGGRLEVHSGSGSTQIIATLPTPPLSAAGTAKGDSQSAESAGALAGSEDAVQPRATILCIDDEATGLLARKLLLESSGYRVIEARSGPEGIKRFQSETIDLVILDYWMSGMKGTTVAAELRSINPATPIIVLSGMSDLPGEAGGLVDRWLLKGSHRAEELLYSISTLLERRTV